MKLKVSKIGMRTTKTVIAVLITLAISEMFNLNSPVLAGIAAIMTIETTVSESFVTGKYRMYGTILGALVGLIITFIAPENFIVIGIGLIIIIYICNMFQWDKAVRMSMIVFLVIILGYEEGYRFSYALNRSLDTFIGVIVGTSINYFLRPPKVEGKLEKSIDEMYIEVKNILENLIWREKQVKSEDLRNRIHDIDENYEALRKEIKYNIDPQESITNYRHIFNLFEKVQNHLSVISPINKDISIDEKNKEDLEKMFLKEIPKKESVGSANLDIIYNYHLNNILSTLNCINAMLEKKKKT